MGRCRRLRHTGTRKCGCRGGPHGAPRHPGEPPTEQTSARPRRFNTPPTVSNRSACSFRALCHGPRGDSPCDGKASPRAGLATFARVFETAPRMQCAPRGRQLARPWSTPPLTFLCRASPLLVSEIDQGIPNLSQQKRKHLSFAPAGGYSCVKASSTEASVADHHDAGRGR